MECTSQVLRRRVSDCLRSASSAYLKRSTSDIVPAQMGVICVKQRCPGTYLCRETKQFFESFELLCTFPAQRACCFDTSTWTSQERCCMEWGLVEQRPFQKTKRLITSDVLGHFDVGPTVVLACDASSYGIIQQFFRIDIQMEVRNR